VRLTGRGLGVNRIGRWAIAGVVTAAVFAAVTVLGAVVVLAPLMEDAAIRWGLASAMGAVLAAVAGAWGHGYATAGPQQPGPTPPSRSAQASAAGSVAVAGDNSGSITTGNITPRVLPQPPAPSQPPVPPAANSTVTASGERSIAIGGNSSGTLSTGDQNDGTGR